MIIIIIIIIIPHQLFSHLQGNNLHNPFQLAYCAGRNTRTALLCINDLRSTWAVTRTLFSYCCVFQPLLTLLIIRFGSPDPKTKLFGTDPSSLQQFWLWSCKQLCFFFFLLVVGVPQWSVLGHGLFVSCRLFPQSCRYGASVRLRQSCGEVTPLTTMFWSPA